MKLQMTKNSFWVVVPKTKVKKKGWTKGTELDWLEYPNGDLVLQEVTVSEKWGEFSILGNPHKGSGKYESSDEIKKRDLTSGKVEAFDE